MEEFYPDYRRNVEELSAILRPQENFDVIRRVLSSPAGEMTFFYVDGFTKDSESQRIMQYLLGLQEIGGAEDLLRRIPYVEVEVCRDPKTLVRAVLAGQTAILASTFSGEAVLCDLRTYPARDTAEPESDKVMQGARDGFVETLVMNTALIRRRIRDPRLTMRHFNLGGSSCTDVVVCYMDGVADAGEVEHIVRLLQTVRPKSLTLGTQSLAETLIRQKWYNPFPKIRTTERPDTAAAQVLEGSVLILCDTSPQVMILPTSLPDYLQQTDDYYFPPLTGTYLRLIRTLILLFSVVCTPLWYLALEYQHMLPQTLRFLIPSNPGALPIIVQLLLVEFAVDGLKIASMNTPDMLSNSLSVVSALIVGDFAVQVGWLCADVILYMAFVAIANFAQQNHELGHAFKFMRLMILILTALLKLPGFIIGIILFCVFAATANTLRGERHRGYLYPLFPWNWKALRHLLFRTPKEDFEDKKDA